MSEYLTSTTLIEHIKREGMVPTAQQTFSDDDFLAIANQEIKIGMLPTIMQFHEEYYAVDSDAVTIAASTSKYGIPYRAVGGKLRELFYQDSNSNLRAMSRVSPDNRPYYQQSNFQNNFLFFFLEGNDVVLTPPVGASPSGSLVFSYYFRPNNLVDESRVGTITGIAVGASTTVFTLDNFPQNLATFYQDGVAQTAFSVSSKLDILQRKPGHKTINFDITPTAIDTVAKTVTFANADVSSLGIIVGDIVAFAGECIIPQIPTDLHPMLVQRVVQRVMQALGDAQGYQIASSKVAEMEKNSGALVDNRTEGSPAKANNINGLMKSSKIGRRWHE